MKILQIITQSNLGGAQSVVINLANELCEKHEVYVAAGCDNNKLWQFLKPSIKKIELKHLYRDISPVNDLKSYYDLLKIRYSLQPDIVHLHSSKIGVLGRLAFNRKKIVYTVHGFDSIRIANRKFLFLEKLLKKKVRTIVAVSKYDVENLGNEGIKNNVICIHNGIKDENLNLNSYNFDNILLHNILKVRENFKHLVCCIARDDKQKKIDLFIEIANNMPDVAFIWIGNKKKYSIHSPNIFLFGEVPNASLYLNYMDLFILPTNYEGLPISIIEALSFSLPVVASNVGGISELIKNDENGLLVKNTLKEFTDAINHILSNEDKYKCMRKAARKTYEDNFTVDKMVKEYENLYYMIDSYRQK